MTNDCGNNVSVSVARWEKYYKKKIFDKETHEVITSYLFVFFCQFICQILSQIIKIIVLLYMNITKDEWAWTAGYWVNDECLKP